MNTVYVTIGNSDDRLKQAEWASFCKHLTTAVEAVSDNVHGVWYSTPGSPFQNMCVCFTTNDHGVTDLRNVLQQMCKVYRQDAIAMAVVETVDMVVAAPVTWEECQRCHRHYAYPHLCRKHMVCGICHSHTDKEEEGSGNG